jgi:uncharacterized membrane protein YozB (DUF420 family)
MNYSQLFSYFGFTWGIIAFCLLIFAWRSAVKGNTRRHRLLMIVLTGGAWLFIAAYLLRYRYPESIPDVPPELIPWLAFHGTVALIPLFGASSLVWARLTGDRVPEKSRHLNRYHRIYGRVIIILWCFTHIGGIANFWLI